MDGVILVAVLVPGIIALYTFLFYSIEGTKGIENSPYFGKKTGKQYTAKKYREKHIV